MIGIPRQPIPLDLGIDAHPTGLGVRQLFQHDNARAFAHHKAIPVGIIGAAGAGRLLGPGGGKSLAGVEASDTNFANRGLGTAGDHHIGRAISNQLRGIANGMGPGGARRRHRVIRPLEAIANAHLPSGQIDQRARNKERRHPARPAFFDQKGGFGDSLKPANPRSDHHTGAQAALRILGFPLGIADGLLGCGNRIENEIIYFAPLARGQNRIRVEAILAAIAKGHFAGVFCRDIAGIKACDCSRTRFPGKQAPPGGFYPAGKRRHHSKTCDNNSAHCCALLQGGVLRPMPA